MDNNIYFEKISLESYMRNSLKDVVEPQDLEMQLKLRKRLEKEWEEIRLPQNSSDGDASDFFAVKDEMIFNGKTTIIHTGIKAHFPVGVSLLILGRSGKGCKFKLRLNNVVGLIDPKHYNNKENEGEIIIYLSSDEKLTEPISIKKGEAICQGLFIPVLFPRNYEHNNVERQGGFGSSDLKPSDV